MLDNIVIYRLNGNLKKSNFDKSGPNGASKRKQRGSVGSRVSYDRILRIPWDGFVRPRGK